LRIPRLNHDANYAAQLDGELKVLPFVTSVRINPLASSITITYSTKKISEIEAKKTILETIEQVNHKIDKANLPVDESTPNNVVFLKFDSKSQNPSTKETDREIVTKSEVAIAQPETVVSTANEATPQAEELSSNELSENSIAEPIETIASETALDTLLSEELSETSASESIALTHEQTTPQVEELSSNEVSETSIAEPVETTASETAPETLPSEEPSPNKVASEQISSIEEVSPLQKSASTSAGIEAQNNDTVTPTVDRVGETLRLTSSALARRLGISAQALTVRSSQPDFTKWSMTKDPEHIGWVFIKSLNKFYSVNL
jgi:hypothetical protein